MGHSVEDLKKLVKPYEKLGTADLLAENREELNKLNAEEKKDLASRLILDCPEDKLSGFSREIEAGRVPQNDEESFHASLAQAFEVRRRLTALVDERNRHPYNLLLDEELNEDLFNNYKELALNVLKDNESAIAERLALTTPADIRSKLARNVTNMFRESAFATKVGAAFAMRRAIETQLLGENPEAFFSSPELRDEDGEFSIDLCLEFSDLFPSLLIGHEKSVGEKLALIESSETRSMIGRILELLNTSAHQQDNPFRLIASAMNPQRSQQQEQATSSEPEKAAVLAPASASLKASPKFAFGAALRKKPAAQTQTLELDEDSSNEDDADEEKTDSTCCNLW